MTDLEAAAGALGGDVHNGGVLAPGPGHSPKDRSMWVVFGPEYPDGFWCKTWAGDDWKACRDHVKWALGIRDGERPKFERTPRPAVNPREIEAKSDFAVKQYYRAQPPQETLVEIYLRHRRIVLTDDVIRADVIRFDPRCGFRLKDGKLIFLPAIVGLFRNIHSDEPRAIHKTALRPMAAIGYVRARSRAWVTANIFMGRARAAPSSYRHIAR
jgi:hypothetical protein